MNRPDSSLTLNAQSYKTLETVTRSEQRVIRQLVEALLYEQLLDYRVENTLFRFSLGQQDYQAIGYIGGFGRIHLETNSIKQILEIQVLSPRIDNIADALATHFGLKEMVKKQLLQELQQTITLCDWNTQQAPFYKERRHLSYRELESAIDEGHPYHPCFKARTGFSLQDHALYGPEQANTFQLHWLAIRRCYLKQAISDHGDSHFWQSELSLSAWTLLQHQMLENNTSWLEYGLMPIHPWQWHNLQQELQEPLEKRHIVHLGIAGDFYQASISVRTLLNVSQPHKANIKLPMNMVNSSSLRTLEAHSVCTAPVLSEWLVSLLEADSFFRQHQALGLLAEYAGILLEENSPESPLIDATKDAAESQENSWIDSLTGQIGVIFRESLEQHHCANKALPFVALMTVETDGYPFIHPWVEHYGCHQWLRQLIKVAVIPVWRLLVHHGIALEAHAQNMILVHDNGWPQKIILRDFHESLEYVDSYIADPSKIPNFTKLDRCYNNAHDNQYYWMTDVEALRELLVDTLFVYNLSELAIVMEQHYQLPEKQFWSTVGHCLEQYSAANHTAEQRISAIDIYQTKVQTESLLRKKLQPNTEQEFHHYVDNPLASTRQQGFINKQQRPHTKSDGDTHAEY
ncbi:MAG: IucA/IucC family protein [Arenicella sp.]